MCYKMLCIMANTSAICQQAAHTTYQPLLPCCSTRAIQKSQTLNRKCFRIFWKKIKSLDHQLKNDKTERARGLVEKQERRTALRFQTGRGHQTSWASLWGGSIPVFICNVKCVLKRTHPTTQF